MSILTLEQARIFKALGGEQNQWPQMVWERWRRSHSGLRDYIQILYAESPRDVGGHEHFAAPDVLTVLDWLEQEKGWHYDTERYQSGTLMGKTWLAYPVDGHGLRLASPIRRSTPSALIDAVFARLRKQREEAG